MKKTFYLTSLILSSALIRLWKLGYIPDGISITEAKMGIFLSDLLNYHVTNLFILRLPFAILGILSIFLFYLLVLKLSGNHTLSILASYLLSLTPLHIHESRIFSLGIVITAVFLLGILLLRKKFEANYTKIIISFFGISLILFTFSVLKFPESAGQKVNWERNIAAHVLPVPLTKLFSNKLIESYGYRKSLFFEHLDFGNYFFSGYPRPRWGVEEMPKLYIAFLPFLAIGFFSLDKRLSFQIIALTVSYSLIISSFSLREPTWDLPFLLLVIYLTAFGLIKFFRTRIYKLMISVFLFLFIFEAVSFFRLYFSGLTESQFSPRSSIYKRLVPQVREFYAGSSSLYISSRLPDSRIYFQFYDPELTAKAVFTEFDLRKDSVPDRLFVGVLPFDPSPSEMLYKKFGAWPEYVDVLYVFPDEKLKQDVVVFRSKI